MTAARNGIEPRTLPRGRPRDASRDEALRAAALAVLADVGYRALTMDAVAATARAGKATIYRRWDSKLDLVIDSCNHLVSRNIPQPNTGSLAEDLREFLAAFATFLSGPAGKAAQALVGELPHEPELAEAFRRSFLRSQRDVLMAVLDRAVARGEVRPDAPHALAVELAGAALTYRLMLTAEPLDNPFVDRLVDQVLVPILSPPDPRTDAADAATGLSIDAPAHPSTELVPIVMTGPLIGPLIIPATTGTASEPGEE